MTNMLARNLGLLLSLSAVLSVVELLVPFRSRSGWPGRLGANLALTALTLATNIALTAGAALVSAALLERGVGLLAGASISGAGTILIAVVVLDFSTYLAHRLMHYIPPLWRVHRLHHADPLVDVTTSLRQHPLESLWRFAFVIGPAWVLGLPIEAVAAYRLVSVVNALFEHTNVRVWQPLDGVLSWLLITPNAHKIHHSRAREETDSNYGNILSLFDRALGTFTPSARAAGVVIGLDGHAP